MSTPYATSHGPAAVATAAKTRVAVIGSGSMGAAIAANLNCAGYSTVLLHPDPSKAEGATRGNTIATNDWRDLADCEFVITMLAGDGAVLDVALEISNVLPTYAVHVSMSTIGEETARELADLHHALGQQYVSAPVLGNPRLAASRGLLVLAAAERETLDRCMSLLECLGRHVVVIGEHAEEANRIQVVIDH
ncbi:NAD(P)-binding domain-containing protein [Paraburkholderia sp. JHI2823]|uniref:NAD(P)-binding domain-containing protein n=1 Tax=Paraburkholderia sp. JHI2823 TaxID=3112960 RepID=UPI00317FDC9F